MARTYRETRMSALLHTYRIGSCTIEVWEDNVRTIFPAGLTVVAADDDMRRCVDHELAHTWIAHLFQGNYSPTYILANRPTPEPVPERKLDVTVTDAARILHRRGAPERDVAPGTWDTLIDHPVWRSQAACTGMSPEFFYPERGQDGGQVRRLCQGCPVAAECLAYALNAGEVHGWWGGLSEKQIRGVRCQLHRAVKGRAA
jgi:WhiB family redox-sensing transcriptional regulator